MSDETTVVARGPGVGFTGLLTLVFIVLKLTGVIGWSWLWVLSPLWITLLVWLAFFAIGFVVLMIFAALHNNAQRKRRRSNGKRRRS